MHCRGHLSHRCRKYQKLSIVNKLRCPNFYPNRCLINLGNINKSKWKKSRIKSIRYWMKPAESKFKKSKVQAIIIPMIILCHKLIFLKRRKIWKLLIIPLWLRHNFKIHQVILMRVLTLISFFRRYKKENSH